MIERAAFNKNFWYNVALPKWDSLVNGATIHNFKNYENNLRFGLEAYEWNYDSNDYTDAAISHKNYFERHEINIMEYINDYLGRINNLLRTSYGVNDFLLTIRNI